MPPRRPRELQGRISVGGKHPRESQLSRLRGPESTAGVSQYLWRQRLPVAEHSSHTRPRGRTHPRALVEGRAARKGSRSGREKPAVYRSPAQALARRRPGGGGRPAAQSGAGFVFILTHFHSRTALCLLLEVTSDWLLPMGLPVFSPRSRELSAR